MPDPMPRLVRRHRQLARSAGHEFHVSEPTTDMRCRNLLGERICKTCDARPDDGTTGGVFRAQPLGCFGKLVKVSCAPKQAQDIDAFGDFHATVHRRCRSHAVRCCMRRRRTSTRIHERRYRTRCSGKSRPRGTARADAQFDDLPLQEDLRTGPLGRCSLPHDRCEYDGRLLRSRPSEFQRTCTVRRSGISTQVSPRVECAIWANGTGTLRRMPGTQSKAR